MTDLRHQFDQKVIIVVVVVVIYIFIADKSEIYLN